MVAWSFDFLTDLHLFLVGLDLLFSRPYRSPNGRSIWAYQRRATCCGISGCQRGCVSLRTHVIVATWAT